jgi:exopolyphosphatase/guanosine-5'-triphosphate,3'-diphosphate pyrophosphatase
VTTGERIDGDRGGGAAGTAVYGAVDLGTNNCRMLVASPRTAGEGGGFRVIDAFSRIVRLGEGVAATGRLSEAAMARTIDALAVCASRMRERGVTRMRNVATQACRVAGNGREFVARVAAATGLAIEPISAAEEAGLALAGCAPLLDRRQPRALVFDIGGGSTELMWIAVPTAGPPAILAMVSLPLGVVGLAERYGGDVVAPPAYAAMRDLAADALARFDAAHGIAAEIAAGRVQMLGTSGTVTTLGAYYLDLPRYRRSRIDGLDVGFAALFDACARLAASDRAARAAHPCIGPERAELVVAGCAILEAICRRWPVGRLRIADRGIREGLLLGLMAADAAAEWS